MVTASDALMGFSFAAAALFAARYWLASLTQTPVAHARVSQVIKPPGFTQRPTKKKKRRSKGVSSASPIDVSYLGSDVTAATASMPAPLHPTRVIDVIAARDTLSDGVAVSDTNATRHSRKDESDRRAVAKVPVSSDGTNLSSVHMPAINDHAKSEDLYEYQEQKWERYEKETGWEESALQPVANDAERAHSSAPHAVVSTLHGAHQATASLQHESAGTGGGQGKKNRHKAIAAAEIRAERERDRIARLTAHRAARLRDGVKHEHEAQSMPPRPVFTQAAAALARTSLPHEDEVDYWRQSPVAQKPLASNENHIWS